MPGIAGSIEHEAEFKVVCDGILRREIGPAVITLAARGKDGGVDARFQGSFSESTGLWVFQYKYAHPATDQSRARGRILSCYKQLKSRRSEFEKVHELGLAGYVLITNVEMTNGGVTKLVGLANEQLPGVEFLVWDRSAVETMLMGAEHLLRYTGDARFDACRELVVSPTWEMIELATRAHECWDDHPLWPVSLVRIQRKVQTGRMFPPFDWVDEWTLHPEGVLHASSLSFQSPIFGYASKVLFPSAFRGYTAFIDAINSLDEVVREHVIRLRMELGRRDGVLGYLEHEDRKEKSLILAYSTIAVAWGFPRELLGVSGISPPRKTPTIIHQGNPLLSGDEVEAVINHLDSVVGALREDGVPDDVRVARAIVGRETERLRADLWWAARLGVDAPLAPLDLVDES